MKICRKCGAKYPDNEEICNSCGQKLHPLPEFLANRPSPEMRASSSSARREADPFIGRHIEKYKIVKKIGEGGMGVVYEAEHIHIGKKVALKILREDYTKKQDVVQRFKQEARSASIIGHPNIIDVTDFGYTHDGRVFFVMEFLEGEDLASILENERVIDYKRAVKLARQICAALEAAHKKGIIHRDMKPENIFLLNAGTKEEKVKILDFGIAKMSVLDQEGRKLTKTGVVFGTPEYMSPEQAAGKPVDKRIDIYALGIMLYEMITGKVPFTGDTFMSILSKHIFEPIPPMDEAEAVTEIPDSLRHLIMKCLEKEPKKRIESAEELSEALEAIGKDEEITMEIIEPQAAIADSGPTPGPVLEVVGEGEVPSARRRGPTALLAAVLILVPLAVISGLVYYKVSSSRESGANPGKTEAASSEHPAGDHEGSARPDEHRGKTEGKEDKEGEDDNLTEGPVPPAEVERVNVKVFTTPGGAVVEVEGQGQKCPTTPCEFEAEKGKTIVLLVRRGKETLSRTITPDEDPTEIEFSIGKPAKKKNGRRKTGVKDKASGGDKEKGTKKIKNIDSGDLKTPDIFRDK